MNWADFFHMGGYAYYVWPAWGLTLCVLIWQVVQAKLTGRRIRREIARQLSRQKISQEPES